MRILTLSLLSVSTALLAACSFYPSRVDDEFGQAMTGARALQTVDPDASSRPPRVSALDGQAAKSTVDRYQKSYDTPPAPTNVFNIGIGRSTPTTPQ